MRDQDGDVGRTRVVKEALAKAAELWPDLRCIGGTAIVVLEAWLLAALGEPGTQALSASAAQRKLTDRGIGAKDTRAMLELISQHLAQHELAKGRC